MKCTNKIKIKNKLNKLTPSNLMKLVFWLDSDNPLTQKPFQKKTRLKQLTDIFATNFVKERLKWTDFLLHFGKISLRID